MKNKNSDRWWAGISKTDLANAQALEAFIVLLQTATVLIKDDLQSQPTFLV